MSIMGHDCTRGGAQRGPMTPAEVAEALARHGVGAVCILKCGMVCAVKERDVDTRTGSPLYDLGGAFDRYHEINGEYNGTDHFNVVCVLPPGTQLHADYTATAPKESLDFAQSQAEGMEPTNPEESQP
jgi:hypothetical protein